MESFICDFIYRSEHRIEMTQVVAVDSWEALEWMWETFIELHIDSSEAPDVLRLRKGEKVLATWETHFDVVN